ncbi:CerR family C-terminal domain-containing protein [Pedosphaera parvula]|uniref:Transcriptional regulator, TetR family n=1 Tax=Pedosphaera parvula (strain Ellin514) TaxID=320771 RepID=B9XCA3_PEDPL|nr:CerR family C-terminal domain-containing protein [Pedosphaera parvula]EEF62571.1 transcriptional regulator, TetR family [Pedosphaera parvula Ellin514]
MDSKSTHSDDAAQAKTRRQLIEAASEVFAEVGFRAATVREICQRAGANIAAVNYHFGDKAQLYRAALQETFKTSKQKYPPNFGLPAKATGEQRLRVFIHSFLLRIFSQGPESRHGKMMAREMIEPSGALDVIVQEEITPMKNELMSIIQELGGTRLSEKKIRLCGMSVVSQVLFYHHCRPVVMRVFPNLSFDASEIEELTDHITSFSLAAIAEIAKSKKK